VAAAAAAPPLKMGKKAWLAEWSTKAVDTPRAFCPSVWVLLALLTYGLW
jgi:hypothetical protein